MEIIRQFDGVFCVRLGKRYHVVRHDPKTNTTSAVHRADIVKGFDPKTAEGFTAAAVKAVSKPRKMTTAIKYWNETLRYLGRADHITRLYFTPESHLAAGNAMAH